MTQDDQSAEGRTIEELQEAYGIDSHVYSYETETIKEETYEIGLIFRISPSRKARDRFPAQTATFQNNSPLLLRYRKEDLLTFAHETIRLLSQTKEDQILEKLDRIEDLLLKRQTRS